MLLSSSSDQSAKQTSAEPVKPRHSAVTLKLDLWGSGLQRVKEGTSSLPLSYISDLLGSSAGGRRPMHYQHLIPSSLEKLKFTISFCFRTSSLSLAKVTLLTAYFIFYCVINHDMYLFSTLILKLTALVVGSK